MLASQHSQSIYAMNTFIVKNSRRDFSEAVKTQHNDCNHQYEQDRARNHCEEEMTILSELRRAD